MASLSRCGLFPDDFAYKLTAFDTYNLKELSLRRPRSLPHCEVRARLATLLFEAWWRPFLRYGIIHGDPHLGNYSVVATGAGEAQRIEAVNLFDYGECDIHLRGLPTRAKIKDLHRYWFNTGIPLVVDMRA